MKLYNHYIEFSDAKGKQFKRDEERSSWVLSEDLANKHMHDDLNWQRLPGVYTIPVAWGIVSKDFEGKLSFVGVLNKDDSSLDTKVGPYSLHKELYSKFHGNRVKITMTILEDDEV